MRLFEDLFSPALPVHFFFKLTRLNDVIRRFVCLSEIHPRQRSQDANSTKHETS